MRDNSQLILAIQMFSLFQDQMFNILNQIRGRTQVEHDTAYSQFRQQLLVLGFTKGRQYVQIGNIEN